MAANRAALPTFRAVGDRRRSRRIRTASLAIAFRSIAMIVSRPRGAHLPHSLPTRSAAVTSERGQSFSVAAKTGDLRLIVGARAVSVRFAFFDTLARRSTPGLGRFAFLGLMCSLNECRCRRGPVRHREVVSQRGDLKNDLSHPQFGARKNRSGVNLFEVRLTF